ncbi:ER membrane protein Wsc4 [Penicillium hispanicum]|uniref:ER membrane protein Wsc4 n=1 Tax=Penicillium hispanicum TaxID=1080232 RepID=UPI002540D11A|nr:ER membrane protein Wsc4 [Penicillium hispanicum]KAJ5573682.1 ER membrane protein Wsc4 [Penicillium hispanicum]
MHLSLLLPVFALLARPWVEANTLAYCATDNTGSSFSSVSSIYQSNGACQETCAKYALGVLQGNDCWCTNVAPSEDSQKSTSDCPSGCPGYPNDSCGSSSKGLFAYVSISGNSVTTTADGSSSSTSSQYILDVEFDDYNCIFRLERTKLPLHVADFAFQSSSSSDTTTTGNVAVQTTSDGEVKTITVPAASSTSGADRASADTATTKDNSKLSGGSIAGIVIGVVGGLALLGALIFMIFFYRKRARSASPVPSQEMGQNSQGSSFVRGVFPQGHNPELSGSSSLGRKATFTDNRMKTDIYPNGPRESSVSLQDNEDYSRPVLRLTNPD